MANDMKEPCPVCGELSQHLVDIGRDWHRYKCPVCGKYEASFEACDAVEALSPSEKALISGVLRELNLKGPPPEILEAKVDDLLKKGPRSLDERLNRLLINLHRLTSKFGESINIQPDMRSLGFAADSREFDELLRQLVNDKLLKVVVQGGHGIGAVSLTANGFKAAEGNRGDNEILSNKAFVAMHFHEKMQEVFENAISPAIKTAGYDVVRVDLMHFNDRIDDHIIGEIKAARFLVADFTGHRGGVYYEAGFAHGLGKQVIMCCSKNAESGVHFDTNHFNHIFYDDHPTFFQVLSKRIVATIGPGSHYVHDTQD